MYNILLFDDRPQSRISLEDKLKSRDMKVFSCRNVYEAKDTWNAKKDELNAIVLDVMMPSSGLDEALRPQTQGGLLTGWIWLWQLNQNHKTSQLAIVIYSAYLDDFKAYMNSEKSSDDEKVFASQVRCIPKGNSDNENMVVDYLCQDYSQKSSLDN